MGSDIESWRARDAVKRRRHSRGHGLNLPGPGVWGGDDGAIVANRDEHVPVIKDADERVARSGLHRSPRKEARRYEDCAFVPDNHPRAVSVGDRVQPYSLVKGLAAPGEPVGPPHYDPLSGDSC